MKRASEIARTAAGVAMVVLMTVASMPGRCQADDETAVEYLGLGPLTAPCTPSPTPGSHSDCSCSTCGDSPVKASIVSRQAKKPHRVSQEPSVASLARVTQLLSSLNDSHLRRLDLPPISSDVLRSIVLVI